ncbi:MAG: TonB-dependent receptor plug domain-containing protein, partial [Sphingobacteriales bacterium]|nr:TonB-dependent receptor plug domain-containing protein [Sphingobacteriales bacterium]
MVRHTQYYNSGSWLYKNITCLLYGFLFFTAAALAQKSTGGKLTGKITDAATGEALVGVSVSVKGKAGGTATTIDGIYILSLSEGVYSVVFSSSGHQKKEISSIVIKAGETTFLDIILQKANKINEGVVITSSAKKESQSAVYSVQKRSSAVSDGISLEAIRKTPDNNAGQILRRVSGINMQDNRFVVVRGLGDQYNQTMLNGVPMTSTETNRNAFAFDLIPAAVIDNITVNKTATPDMPGNFAGGIVQINTKDFPTNDFFSATLQVGFSSATYSRPFYSDKRSQFEILGFGAKSRDLPADFPTGTSRVPIYIMNTQEQTRYLRMLPNNLAPTNYGRSGLNEGVQFGYGKTIKFKNQTQFGIVAALNQRKTSLIENEITARDPDFTETRFPDTLQGLNYYSNNIRYRYSVDFGGVLNLAYRFGNNKVTFKNLYTQVFNNTFIYRPSLSINSSGFSSGDSLTAYSYITEQKNILNSVLAGEHRTGADNETRLDWNVNITSNKTDLPDLRNFIFIVDPIKKILKSSSNAGFEESLTGFSRSWSISKDFIYGGAFNLTTPFTVFNSKQLLKGGIL